MRYSQREYLSLKKHYKGLQSDWELEKLRLLKKEKTKAQLSSSTVVPWGKKKWKNLVYRVLRNYTEAIYGECKKQIIQCNIRNNFLQV